MLCVKGDDQDGLGQGTRGLVRELAADAEWRPNGHVTCFTARLPALGL